VDGWKRNALLRLSRWKDTWRWMGDNTLRRRMGEWMGEWMDGQRDGSATHCCEQMEGYMEMDGRQHVEKKDG
jgi:hypothetical protein